MSERFTDDELSAATALAEALEGRPTEDEDLADLVRVAEAARASAGLAAPLDGSVRASAVADAVAAMRPRRRPFLRWVAGGLAAAAVLMVVGGGAALFAVRQRAPAPVTTPVARLDESFAGPTDALFDGPFADDQSPAERVDRIVAARTRGYFAALIAERSERSAVVTAGLSGGER